MTLLKAALSFTVPTYGSLFSQSSLLLLAVGRNVNSTAVTAFGEKFDPESDPEQVIIDITDSRIADMSGIEALNKLTERYAKEGKKLHLRHLSDDCRLLLENAESVIEVNIMEDPHYKIAVE